MPILSKARQKLILQMVIVAFAIICALGIYFLFFIHAKVSVEVSPASAVVTLDNRPISVTGGVASTITTLGKHTLKVDADNYVGYKTEINLTRGKNFSEKITLAKAPTPVEIAASAAHIAIFGDKIFYQSLTDNLFYMATTKTDNLGNTSVIASQQITSTPIDPKSQIIWSPDRNLMIVKSGTTAEMVDFKKYDFIHQTINLYSNDVGDIAWAPDNSRIAYVYQPVGGERSLIFADANNQNIYRVLNLKDLEITNPYIAFSPDSSKLVLIPRNDPDYGKNKIYLLNVYTKELSPVISAGNQKEAIFSADSKKIIYSTYSADPANPLHLLLSIANFDGSGNKALGIAGQASTLRYWTDPEEVFLPPQKSSDEMKLLNLTSGETLEFYFANQKNLPVSEVQLNDNKTGAIFASGGKLYFVKLESN